MKRYTHSLKNVEVIRTAFEKCISRINYLRTRDDGINGVPSGFTDLDRITHGWQPSDLIVIAARPSMGKTTFALNLARNAVVYSVKPVAVGFFSLDVSTSQLVQRLISAESEIPLGRIEHGKLQEYEYRQLFYKNDIQRLINAPLFIDDTGVLNIFELKQKARSLVSKHNVGLIIIDFLQYIRMTNNNPENALDNLLRNLKALAKELNIPVIVLSQVNPSVEKRKGRKMPQLKDLREEITQYADTIIFIYRPEYYERYNPGRNIRGETHFKIAKHRNGSLETIKLRAKLSIQKFCDW